MKDMNRLFYEMLNKGLASTSRRWIELAAQQRSPRLTMALAHSILLNYSALDKVILQCQSLN